ncbi:hypothetical protein LCGC14_0811640 [marine sediment metagenome]|uniref:Uncharacterized protein n=1 Tax=marine sediment metagenome TaxID=412755 RepID=A0A0F9S6E5_9ZZZZ
MSSIPVDLEVERVMNLVRGFGWEKREQRIETDKVVLIIDKKIDVEPTKIPT